MFRREEVTSAVRTRCRTILFQRVHEVNERQAKADRQRRKAGRRLAVCRAHDDEQEQHGHHDFRQQRRKKIIVARRMLRVAVGRESLAEIKTRSALGNGIEQKRSHDGADDLGDDVGNDFPGGKAAARRQSHGHRRVEVAS